MTSSNVARNQLRLVTGVMSDRVRSALNLKPGDQLPWDTFGRIMPEGQTEPAPPRPPTPEAPVPAAARQAQPQGTPAAPAPATPAPPAVPAPAPAPAASAQPPAQEAVPAQGTADPELFIRENRYYTKRPGMTDDESMQGSPGYATADEALAAGRQAPVSSSASPNQRPNAPAAAQPAARREQLTLQMPPARHNGKKVTDPVTGIRYQSDGVVWQEIQ